MIAAPLMVHRDGEKKLWGVFQFDALPSPGDRIDITAHDGRVQQLTVTYVAHQPLHEKAPQQPDHHTSWVHAEWVSEFY